MEHLLDLNLTGPCPRPSVAVTLDHNLTYFSYFMLANEFLIKMYERQFRKF